MYLTKPTFFSRINGTVAKTLHDEYWHPHIDKVMGRSLASVGELVDYLPFSHYFPLQYPFPQMGSVNAYTVQELLCGRGCISLSLCRSVPLDS